MAFASGTLDFDSFVPIHAKYVLSENFDCTDGLVDKGVGQGSLLFAEVQVSFQLFCSDGFRRLTVMPAQLYEHTQVAGNRTFAVVTELEFSDKPITQAFFFFFISVDLNFPHRRYYNYEKLPTVGGFVQRPTSGLWPKSNK